MSQDFEITENRIEYVLLSNRHMPRVFKTFNEAMLAHYDATRDAKDGDSYRVILRRTLVEEFTLQRYRDQPDEP